MGRGKSERRGIAKRERVWMGEGRRKERSKGKGQEERRG